VGGGEECKGETGQSWHVIVSATYKSGLICENSMDEEQS
jgi:hypothetical protein